MKNKKIIAALIISILIFVPFNIEASGFGHVSHTSHTSSHISKSSGSFNKNKYNNFNISSSVIIL